MAEETLQWATDAQIALASGPVAMVTITHVQGSAPREKGARMVVTSTGFTGSIGGGKLEYIVLEQARKMLLEPAGSWRIQNFPLGPLLGQCCGGHVQVLVEHLQPHAAEWLAAVRPGTRLLTDLRGAAPVRRLNQLLPEQGGGTGDDLHHPEKLVETLPEPARPVLMVGAGHVGRAISCASAGLPLAISWYDTRPEYSAGCDADALDEKAICELMRSASADTAILILTHDHALDYRLAAAALSGDARFVGLIGSKSKAARFGKSLAKDGIDPARLVCPIGTPGVQGKSPAVIAIAVLAQLLSLDAVSSAA